MFRKPQEPDPLGTFFVPWPAQVQQAPIYAQQTHMYCQTRKFARAIDESQVQVETPSTRHKNRLTDSHIVSIRSRHALHPYAHHIMTVPPFQQRLFQNAHFDLITGTRRNRCPPTTNKSYTASMRVHTTHSEEQIKNECHILEFLPRSSRESAPTRPILCWERLRKQRALCRWGSRNRWSLPSTSSTCCRPHSSRFPTTQGLFASI